MTVGLGLVSGGLFIIIWTTGMIVMALPEVADFSELERHAIFGQLAFFLMSGAWSVKEVVAVLMDRKSKQPKKKKSRA